MNDNTINKRETIVKLREMQTTLTELLLSLEAEVTVMSLDEFREYLNERGADAIAKDCGVAHGVFRAIAKGGYSRVMRSSTKDAILFNLGIKIV